MARIAIPPTAFSVIACRNTDIRLLALFDTEDEANKTRHSLAMCGDPSWTYRVAPVAALHN